MNLICTWYVMELCLRGKARESVIYKVHIASRIYQAWRKGLHCVQKLQLWAQKVMKRKGLQALKHCQHREN